jgi:hypothetical protein
VGRVTGRKDNVLKKTITYKDFNDEEVSEDFFFHLSKAELVELELSHEGGLSASLERIVAAEDGKSIIAEFKNIILSSYGKRSIDGKRFVKNQEIRDEFESTEAYSTLFMELVTDTDAAVEFINGVIPKGMAEEAAKLARNENKPELEAVPPPNESATYSHEEEVQAAQNLEAKVRAESEPRILTKADLDKMPPQELATLGDRIQSGEVKLAE